MLRELRVRNLALLEDVRVAFEPGLCVVTGATGAGKSLLLAALDLLLGGRFSREMLRTGADEARVEGLFDVTGPAARARIADISGEDAGEVVLRRRVDASGRNRCEVQGSLVPVATLRDVGRLLVEIHGQSEHQALLEPAEQTLLLDRAAGLGPEREAFAGKLAAWQEARRRLEDATSGAERRAARLEALDGTVAEIREAALRVGEQEELRAERALLADATRHAASIDEAIRLVEGDDRRDGASGAIDDLGRAARALEATARLDPAVREALGALENASSLASDAARALRDAAERVEADPARLEAVEDRLERIGGVLRRHGPTEADALATLEAARAEASSLRGGAEGAEALADRLRDAAREALSAGTALDASRREAGAKFAAAVESALADLGMPGTRFRVHLHEPGEDALARATPLGLSRVEFLVSPNRGEDLRAMSRIASGGELARIALAVRGQIAGGSSAGSAGEGTPLLVFDEIDADVGPRMGAVIGERLARLAEGRQVLAVTHLPQVAACAAHHVRVAKRVEGDRTVAVVEVVEGRRREQELEEMRGERTRKGAARA